jgi:serine/threonine protein kinase
MADPPEPMPHLAPLRSYDPRSIGEYRLLGRLGSGGQGDVFLGLDPLGGHVAVKTIRVELFNDPRAPERLARELATAARVRQFCTARIIASGLEADLPYVVSEFIPGKTLHQHVQDAGTMSGDDLERLAVGTVAALTAIHRAGVVHCDFKPDNVILGPLGPRVIDFGIAQVLDATHTMTAIRGFPPYMAPERMAGAPPRSPCDIFAWAATIAFAASGRPPFGRDQAVTLYRRMQSGPPELEGLPPAMEDLIRQCLDKDEGRRPDAQQILFRLLGYGDEAELETVLVEGSDEAGQLRPTSSLERTQPFEPAPPPAPPPPRVPLPAPGTQRQGLRGEAGDAWAISAAIFLGALGGAVGYVASAEPGPATAVGATTFAVVYLVRLLLAVRLQRSGSAAPESSAQAPSTGPPPSA